MSSPVTVAVVDDHAIGREGVTLHLSHAVATYEVVGSGSSIDAVPAEPAPDVVLIDLVLRTGDCLQGHRPGNTHHLTRLAYEEGHLR